MFRNKYAYLAGILVIFIALITVQHYAPTPVDWTENYDITSKSPYGCYVTNKLLNNIFPSQKINYNENIFFEFKDTNNYDQKNILIITNDFSPDKYDLKALLNLVEKGSNLLIAAENFGYELKDSLKFKIETKNFFSAESRSKKDVVFLENLELKNDSGFRYDKNTPLIYFSKYDSLTTTRLGTNQSGKPNFVHISMGKGHVYLHTQPLLFTNYYLLYGNIEYVSKVLSYLPVKTTVFDLLYKPFRYTNRSPVRYILSQDALRSAYYLLLIGLLLYMFFQSKRRQRVIPLIEPPKNRSLEFTKTVGQLYYKRADHNDLARKMSIYFKEYLREHYFLNNLNTSNDCSELVSTKSGVPIELVKPILQSTLYYENAQIVTKEGLIQFNKKIETFYKQCK
jgi:hypothetical protein